MLRRRFNLHALDLISPQQQTANNCADTTTIPSLIIPYLYVGDHEHTKLETLRLHKITYILSLQALPLFLGEHNSCQLQPQQHQQPPQSLQTATQQQHNNNSSSNSNISNNSQNHNNHIHIHNHNHKYQYHHRHHHLNQDCGFRDDTIRVKCINVADSHDQLLDNYFDETQEFIDEARQNKCNVLVHCKAGISRSPAITIAYLMKSLNLSLTDAYNLVKGRRPQISPNLNFMGQLVVYEEKLKTMRKEKKPMSPRLETINNVVTTTNVATTTTTTTTLKI